MKIDGSKVRSVKQILQLNPIVFLLKAFSYPEPPVSLLAMVLGFVRQVRPQKVQVF